MAFAVKLMTDVSKHCFLKYFSTAATITNQPGHVAAFELSEWQFCFLWEPKIRRFDKRLFLPPRAEEFAM